MIWQQFKTDLRVALEALDMSITVAHDQVHSNTISITIIDRETTGLVDLDGSVKHLGVFCGYNLFEVSLDGFDPEIVSSGKGAAAVCYA